MRDQQIKILIELFKKKEIKEAFVRHQYHLPQKAGSLMLSQRNVEMRDMVKEWIKKEEKINKFWLTTDWSLTKLLIKKSIIPAFPNNYLLDEANWAVNKSYIFYEDIMFVETDNGFKLISVLDKTQLTKLKDNGHYLEKAAATKVLNNLV